MATRRFTAKQKHLEELRCVFGLGGGELREQSWCGRSWYDGAPEYAATDAAAAATQAGCDPLDMRTALECRVYTGGYHVPRGWREVASFRSSGETACWWCGAGCEGCGHADCQRHKQGCKRCKLCGGAGLVYLGEGWCEVVYARLRQGGTP